MVFFGASTTNSHEIENKTVKQDFIKQAYKWEIHTVQLYQYLYL